MPAKEKIPSGVGVENSLKISVPDKLQSKKFARSREQSVDWLVPQGNVLLLVPRAAYSHSASLGKSAPTHSAKRWVCDRVIQFCG